MKNILNLIVLTFVLSLASPLHAQQVTVKVRDGHYAPLSARITYRDGKCKDVIVVRSWYSLDPDSQPEIGGVGDGGSDVKLWLDTIAMVKGATDKEFTLVMRDGSERTLGYNMYYTGFVMQNADGSTEFVKMCNFKSLEFTG